LDDLN